MPAQNYETHRRWVPTYHFVLPVLILVALLASCVNVYLALRHGEGRLEAVLIALVVVAVAMTFYFARAFALKAQDRAIRAEENLRHFVLTESLLDPRLTIRQVIGLRFSSDAEFVDLARRAAEEKLSEEAIKKAVKNWREDDYRA